VLRRNPDSKWRLQAEDLTKLRALQSQILQDYSIMVKVGGFLTYSTCSVLPSENEFAVENFLHEQKGRFKSVDQWRIDPDLSHGDGFFISMLERIS
jgi:16S rRNA (cytosine967-C5)-methyltransferase